MFKVTGSLISYVFCRSISGYVAIARTFPVFTSRITHQPDPAPYSTTPAAKSSSTVFCRKLSTVRITSAPCFGGIFNSILSLMRLPFASRLPLISPRVPHRYLLNFSLTPFMTWLKRLLSKYFRKYVSSILIPATMDLLFRTSWTVLLSETPRY